MNVSGKRDCCKTHLFVRQKAGPEATAELCLTAEIIVSPVAKNILDQKKKLTEWLKSSFHSIFSEFLNLLENSSEKFLVHKCGF